MKPSRVNRQHVLLLVLLFVILFHGLVFSLDFQKDVQIPMPDGVKLSTNIFLPDINGKYPVILVRTPYGKGGESDWGKEWAENGFVFVIQDCRGTGKSEGEWYPGIHEKKDGIDIRKWILKQTWCDGNIGTTGGSYLGFTQFASSTESTQGLKAMYPVVPLLDWYDGVTYISGTLSIGTAMGWGLAMAAPNEGEEALIDEETFDWDEAYRKLPLIEFDQSVGRVLPWMRDLVRNPTRTEYWNQFGAMDLKENCKVPIIISSGWYDIFIHQALDYMGHAIETGKKNQHLIVGPWGHGPNHVPGVREMGENHELDLGNIEQAWFNHWLKGENETVDLPPIKLFVMGNNVWRDETEWPLKRTRYVNYYLHSGGRANSLYGDGMLSLEKPGKKIYDQYIYDPEIPVPTNGGALLFGEPGVQDQREIEMRQDVLVYTSTKMEKDLEVTGNIKVILYASTDSKDTDWTAKLVDVYPDGRSFNLCDGVIRARYAKNPLDLQLITPNKIYKYEIDLWATSNVFLKGHRIRVEISSSNFPRFDRNPNTGNEFGMDDRLKKARQRIYHEKEYPSHIILPVIDP